MFKKGEWHSVWMLDSWTMAAMRRGKITLAYYKFYHFIEWVAYWPEEDQHRLFEFGMSQMEEAEQEEMCGLFDRQGWSRPRRYS